MFDPKTQGFFPVLFDKYYDLILKGAPLEQSSLEDKLRSVWKQIKPEAPFKKVSCLFGEKSDKRSAEIRGQGNNYFVGGNYANALLQYSIAIFTASSSSRDMALALANRSAALQKLSRFSEALTDINYVIEGGAYPKDKMFKLYERQAEIYESLIHCGPGDNESKYRYKLKTVIESALKHIGLSTLNKEKQNNFVINMKEKLSVKPSTDSKTLKFEEDPKFADETNPCLEMKYEPGRGRYMVATADILPGETIMLESPGSFSLHPDKYRNYCQLCFKIVSSGSIYPCERCTWVSFCCLKCREKGMAFHQFECGINKWYLTSGLNIYPFLILRTLTQLGPTKLNEIKGSIFEKRNESLMPVVTTKEDTFMSIFQLNCHEEFLTPEEWGLRILIALFMTHTLKVSGFLAASNLDDFSDEDFLIGSIVLRLLNACPSNCHDISEYETPVKGMFTPASNVCSLGAGIYPLLAMFNHSCNPSFMRCNIGNKVWCVSNRTIKKGEEVFENYGIMFTTKSQPERKRVLKSHYKFDCLCIACKEIWPDTIVFKQRISEITMDRFDRIYCWKCSKVLSREDKRSSIIQCPACLEENDVNNIPLKQLIQVAPEVESAFSKGDWSKGLDLLRKADVLLTKNGLRHPVYDFTEMQISLWRGMWVQRGTLRYVKML